MKAGFARADITPPLGTQMLGYGVAAVRLSESNHDPLYLRVAYVSHDGHEALICSFDFCFIAREDADRWRGVISRELGVRADAVLLAYTHTHAGPAIGTYLDLEFAAPRRDYVRFLETTLIDTARKAIAGAREARIRATRSKTNVGLQRRKLRDGKIVNAPNPGGLVHDSLPICLIEDTAGKPIVLLFSVATHVVAMGKKIVSADYPGVACDELDKHLGATCSLFLQGCAGDSRPRVLGEGREDWNWGCGWAEAYKIGQGVASEVKAALPSLKQAEPRVRIALIDTHWPLVPWTKRQFEEHLAKHTGDSPGEKYVRSDAERQLALLAQGRQQPYCGVLMHGIQLAEGVRMIVIEGEPLAPHGIAMEKAFADGITFALGYANGESMYLVASEQIDAGGYEVESFAEFGKCGPLAKGLEVARDGGVAELKRRGIM